MPLNINMSKEPAPSSHSQADTDLPAPRHGGGALRAVIWAIIFLALVGALAFWLTREPENRSELRTRAADALDSALQNTPLAGLGEIIRETPPAPPPVITPPTDAGTLAGHDVRGTIAAPIDGGVMPRPGTAPGDILDQPALSGTPSQPFPAGGSGEASGAEPQGEYGGQMPGHGASTLDGGLQSPFSAVPEPQTGFQGADSPGAPQPGLGMQPQPDAAQGSRQVYMPGTAGSLAAMERQERGEPALVFSSEPLPPVTEDSRIPAQYLQEVAQWLVDHYRPSSSGGTLAVNVRNANQLLGVTIAGQSQGGRPGLMRYAFHPGMLQGLYHLYINRFMGDLNTAANKRGLDETQNRQFHHALAGRSAMVASVIEGALQIPNLESRLERIDALAQNGVEINAQLAEAIFELDELRENKASSQQIATTQMRVDGITARYRRSVEEQAQAKRALAAEIRSKSGQNLDEDSLLFMASWVERRLASGQDGAEAVKNCATLLHDLARRCATVGAAPQGQ